MRKGQLLIPLLVLAALAACRSVEAGIVGARGPCVNVVLLDVNRNGPNISTGGVRATSRSDGNCPKIRSVRVTVFSDKNGNGKPDTGEPTGITKFASLAVPGYALETGMISFNQNDAQNGGSHYYIEVTDEHGEISTFGGTI